MTSAASHQVIFFAMAFSSTSCSFIIRSTSAAEYRSRLSNLKRPAAAQFKRTKNTERKVFEVLSALAQNPGIEAELRNLAQQAHVYVGTGVGSLDTTYKASIRLHEAQRRWNAFWARPENNGALRAASSAAGAEEPHADDEEWCAHWMARSPELGQYLAELAEIENLGIEGKIEAGKLHNIREKEKRRAKLQDLPMDNVEWRFGYP